MNQQEETSSRSLGQWFNLAQEKYQILESSVGGDVQSNVSEAIIDFQRVRELVDKLRVFSANEELEDIGTNDLRYILTDYYLGELYSKIVDSSFRIQNLKASKNAFTAYLNQCESLNLISKEDLKVIHSSVNSETDRAQKIARFKREKFARTQLDDMLKKKRKTKKDNGRGYITKNSDEDDTDDEEQQRSVTLLLIEVAVYKAIESLELTRQELEMLQEVQQIKQDNNGKLPEPPKHPPFKNVVILPTTREQKYQEVFKRTNVATMTPEEWADEQMRLGFLPTPEGAKKAQEEQTKKQKEAKEKEDTEEVYDMKTWKDRDMDEFKESHPRGSGNKNDHYFRRS